MFNSAFTLFKSPKIVYENPELSPLQVLSKFQITNKKSSKESEEEVAQRSVNNFDIQKMYEETNNKSTPFIKTPIHSEKKFREIIDLKGNIIINHTDEEKSEHKNQSDQFNFSSSLKRNSSENNYSENSQQTVSNFNHNFSNSYLPNVTNIIINYQNINFPVLEKPRQFGSQMDSYDSHKMSFKLNEIVINGKKIEHLINLQIGESNSIEIFQPLYENNFYKLNKKITHSIKGKRNSKFFHNLLNLVEDAGYINKLITTPKFTQIFGTKFQKISGIPLDPLNAYKKCVNDFKKLFFLLQNDYVSKIKKRLNNNIITKLEDSIDDFNNLVDVIFECVNYIKRGKGTKRKKKVADYICEICDKNFLNAQSKGGHMSKMHPNESLKYKSKILVRDSRVKLREIVLQAKKELLAKYNFNYNQLMENMEKHVISEILKLHKSEYNKIKKQLKTEKLFNSDDITIE